MAWIIKTVGKNIARNNRLSLVGVQKRTSRYSRLEKAERLNYIVMNKDPSKYRWYQCDIIRKNGNRDFWCRFIAVSDQEAEERIITTLRKTLTGSIKAIAYQILAKHFIADFDIFRIPEDILKRYDFLKADEADAFYRKVKG